MEERFSAKKQNNNKTNSRDQTRNKVQQCNNVPYLLLLPSVRSVLFCSFRSRRKGIRNHTQKKKRQRKEKILPVLWRKDADREGGGGGDGIDCISMITVFQQASGTKVSTMQACSYFWQLWALRPQKPLRLIRDGEVGGSGIIYLTPTRYTVTTRMILH